ANNFLCLTSDTMYCTPLLLIQSMQQTLYQSYLSNNQINLKAMHTHTVDSTATDSNLSSSHYEDYITIDHDPSRQIISLQPNHVLAHVTRKKERRKKTSMGGREAINNKMNRQPIANNHVSKAKKQRRLLHNLRPPPACPLSCRTWMSAGTKTAVTRHDWFPMLTERKSKSKETQGTTYERANSHLLPTTVGIINNMLNLDTRGVVS
ncbi:unnamed protein product, partial [Ectocarpus sp. 12 AP-2014]